MQRCVIVGAAPIADYERVRSFLQKGDFFIFCDAGLSHAQKLGVQPNLIIGDFDSFKNPNLEVETIVLPSHKDDTDVFFAAKEAVQRGFEDFLFLGVIGARFDHSLCNISVLLFLDDLKKNAVIVDDFSILKIISGQKNFIEDDCEFFSLMCVEGAAEGVTIKNAEYNLKNAFIKPSYQYTISNKVVLGKKAEVCIKKGRLLLVKVFVV